MFPKTISTHWHFPSWPGPSSCCEMLDQQGAMLLRSSAVRWTTAADQMSQLSKLLTGSFCFSDSQSPQFFCACTLFGWLWTSECARLPFLFLLLLFMFGWCVGAVGRARQGFTVLWVLEILSPAELSDLKNLVRSFCVIMWSRLIMWSKVLKHTHTPTLSCTLASLFHPLISPPQPFTGPIACSLIFSRCQIPPFLLLLPLPSFFKFSQGALKPSHPYLHHSHIALSSKTWTREVSEEKPGLSPSRTECHSQCISHIAGRDAGGAAISRAAFLNVPAMLVSSVPFSCLPIRPICFSVIGTNCGSLREW